MSETPKQLILTTKARGVTTLTMNNPRRLNGWTLEMMDAFKAALREAAVDEETKALVFTGVGEYYSAGVNLGGTLKLAHPKKLHAMIIEHNQGLFDAFLDFPKPILAAVNGPAIGAAVTTATLCDAIIASENATFSTPFHRLGVTPEGCSSVLFERIMGKGNAERMLGAEGWKPTAAEAHEAGFVHAVTSREALLERAQALAEEWIEAGVSRRYPADSTLEELKAVNAAESIGVANSFLGKPFLRGQARFLWSKKKRGPAIVFYSLWFLHPLWSRLLD